MQIGWCQLGTVFSAHDGVGDESSSYAFDGFRVVKWNADKNKYGRMLETGKIKYI
jgi:hypothetical protein